MLTRRAAIGMMAGALPLAIAPRWAQGAVDPDWTTVLGPFRIAGNLYYVGSRDLASYLVATPQGLILINSNLVSSPPQIQASVEKLGFHWRDVKILLISQAHNDHCSGGASMLKSTGAQYMVMDGDVPVVESGGKLDWHFGGRTAMRYPPAKVARVLHDGDKVELGGTRLVARKTAGHTKGCTTWTMVVDDEGKRLNAVIIGGLTMNPGYNLINDPKYPQMAADYEAAFRTSKSLPCDLFLGAHGGYFDLLDKFAAMKSAKANPFIDPAGYQAHVAAHERTFDAELEKQKKAARLRAGGDLESGLAYS